jgi:AraC-like DNA-binding protein
MSDAFTRLLHIWQAKENGYEWYTRVALLDLVETISRELQTAAPSWNQAAGRVHAATEFIKLRFPDRISREDLARHVSLSPSYFSTVFRQFTGYGPMQYLARVRVEAAKGLLRDSSLPVHEVAQAVGFTDPYYFARVFKRQTGLSAQEYRRS